MEAKKEVVGMLDLMIRPGFCVEDNVIVHVNKAAQALLLMPGTDVRELLLTGQAEYAALGSGCLYLRLDLLPGGCGASVTKVEDMTVFLLDQEADDDALRALALAARTLREPLSTIQLSLERLHTARQEPEEFARINRAIHQMLRTLGNMSDAGHSLTMTDMELRDIPKLIREILDRAQSAAGTAGMSVRFHSDAGSILGLVDEQLLERGILNVISNFIKFSPGGKELDVRLSRSDRRLILSMTDSSCTGGSIQQDLFRQYLRQPGVEESRHGLGLGMVMVRNAAAKHGGTVLNDYPDGKGMRISITLVIRQDTTGLHCPVMRVDYAGNRDHGLLELADCLPLEAYYRE